LSTVRDWTAATTFTMAGPAIQSHSRTDVRGLGGRVKPGHGDS
jgi:hypothetical protein